MSEQVPGQRLARAQQTATHYVIHCNTLQYTTTHCNMLQHIAAHCNTLQNTSNGEPADAIAATAGACTLPRAIAAAFSRFALRVFSASTFIKASAAAAFSALACVAVWCSVIQCVAVRCSVLQCVAECCIVLQCVAACVAVCVAVSKALLKRP